MHFDLIGARAHTHTQTYLVIFRENVKNQGSSRHSRNPGGEEFKHTLIQGSHLFPAEKRRDRVCNRKRDSGQAKNRKKKKRHKKTKKEN